MAAIIFAEGSCPFSSGKTVVDAVQKIHSTIPVKVGNAFSQGSSVRQMVTMPLGVEGVLSSIYYLGVCLLMSNFPLSININSHN